MKDPERLLRGGATPAERRLLDAGAAEEPPDGGAARLMAALLPPLGGAPGPESLPPPAPPGALGSLVAKWGLVAAGVVTLGGAAIVVATQSGTAEDRSPATVTPAASAAPASAPSIGVPRPPAAQVQSAPVDPVEARHAAVPELPRKRVESGSIGGAPSIAREILALDQVRAFLARGEGRNALDALEKYRAQSPRGALGQEATLLRIEALVLAGDRPAARRLALKLLSDHPGTPHEKRVRALTGAAP